jgi:hypothetical protein
VSRVLPLQLLQSFRLIQVQVAVFLSPAVVGLLGDFGFLAGLRGCLSVPTLVYLSFSFVESCIAQYQQLSLIIYRLTETTSRTKIVIQLEYNG